MATVYSSIFNPVTFDEMLKPHQMYTEAYNQQQGVVNDLDTKASVWEKLAASEKDKDTYDRYKEYENTLRAKAEEISKYGLTPNTRKAVGDLRVQYAKDIVPIEQANIQLEKIKEEQRKAALQNDSIMFDLDSRRGDISLTDLISNPELSYTPIFGSTMRQRGIDRAKSASTLQDMTFEFNRLNNQFFKVHKHDGYTERDLLNFIQDNSSIPELSDIIMDIKQGSHYDRLNEQDQNKAASYILDGIKVGMAGKDDISLQQDNAFLEGLRRRSDKTPQTPNPELNYTTVDIYNVDSDYKDSKAKVQTVHKALETLSTPEGIKEWHTMLKRPKYIEVQSPDGFLRRVYTGKDEEVYNDTRQAFYNAGFTDADIMISSDGKTASLTPSGIKKVKELEDKGNSSVVKGKEYTYHSNLDQDQILNALFSNNSTATTGFAPIKFNGTKFTPESNNKKIGMANVLKYLSNDDALNSSEYNTYMKRLAIKTNGYNAGKIILYDNSTQRAVDLPPEIFPVEMQNTMTALKQADANKDYKKVHALNVLLFNQLTAWSNSFAKKAPESSANARDAIFYQPELEE